MLIKFSLWIEFSPGHLGTKKYHLVAQTLPNGLKISPKQLKVDKNEVSITLVGTLIFSPEVTEPFTMCHRVAKA